MRYLAVFLLCLAGGAGPAMAQFAQAQSAPSCPGHPDAIGISRTITVDPATQPHIGTMQYPTTLPLKDHEVVLTFDDGPLPPNTERILATLKANCVTATFFMVGQMASTYPWLARDVYNDGNTIGTHSEHHPFHLNTMPLPRMKAEVDGGIAAVSKALGDARAVSPFFRIPGLAHGKRLEEFLASRHLAVWSADEVADDWHHGITPAEIVHLAISRIDAKHHRGVLLLHDIHPATALALPILLEELKQRGYHIVRVLPPGERPKALPPLPEPPVLVRLDRMVARRDRAITQAMMALHRPGTRLGPRKHRFQGHELNLHSQASELNKIDYAANALERRDSQY